MKNKKSLLIMILGILLISFVSIGVSIWIISSKTVIKPQNATEAVVKKYLELSCKEAHTYNGAIQLPTHVKLDTSELKYYYKDTNGQFVEVTDTIGPKSAGTYEIQVSYIKTNGTDVSEEITITLEQKFTISPKELTLSWSNTTFTYDGNPHLPTATINNGLITGDICNVSVSVSGHPNGPTDVGSYEAVATIDNSNYTLSNPSTTFNIKNLKQVLSLEAADVQTTTYNGALQNPTISNVYLQTVDDDNNPIGEPTVLDSSQYTLSYTYASNIQPINASIYNITITATYNLSSSNVENGTKTVEFQINKATPTITIHPTFTSIFEGELDGSYTPSVLEAGKATFGDKDVVGSFTFKEISSFSERSNKKYYYDINGTTDASGYVAQASYVFKPNDTTNFETLTILDLGKITIKPIAFSGSTYYGSIEHALDKVTSGTINVIAEVSEGKRRIRSSCTIANGVVLQFLYSTSTTIVKNQTDYYPNETKSGNRTYALDNSNSRKNLVYLDSEVVVTNNGTIIIGGIISSGAGGNGPNCQTCADYAEIIMKSNSQLINNENSYLINYGSIKDESSVSSGNVIINKNATMQMPFIVIEHRGGSIFSGIYKNLKGAAFNRFFFQNISSELTFNAGGIFLGYANLYASKQDNETKINIVGSSSSYLINLQNGAYFKAKYDNTTKVNKIDFYGDMELNSLDMKVVGQNVSTAKVFFPISWYYDITTNKLPTSSSNAQVTLNQDIKLMPGATLRIGENVEVVAKNIIIYDTFNDVNVGCGTLYPKDKGTAKLYVNGKLTVLDSGSIGGLIETEVNGAQLVVSPNAKTTVTSYEFSGSSGSLFMTSVTWSEYTKAFIFYPYTSSGTSTVAISGAPGTMYSHDGGWYSTTMSINYESFGGTSVPAKTGINIDTNGYIVVNADLPTISKDYYSFDGWYLDDTYSQKITENTVLYCSVTLFAKWIPTEYGISYIDKYSDGSNPEISSTNNNPSTFTIETVKSLSEAVNGNYVFGGWFIDEECTIKISMLKGQELVEKLIDGHLNIYALWYPQGTDKYVITFENDSTDVTCEKTFTQVVTDSYDWSTYQLPVMTGKDNDYSVSKYFGGWYDTNDNLVETITSDMFIETNGTYKLTLRAKWLDKNTLTVEIPLSNLTSPISFDVYYKSGTKFTIPKLEDKGISLTHNSQTNSGDVLIDWIDNNGTTYNTNSQMELTNQTKLTANIKKYIKLKIDSNDYTTATVTLVKGQGYIVTVTDNIPAAQAFNDETYTNGSEVFITVGSNIKAYYSKKSGENNGATMKTNIENITLGTTDTVYEIKEQYESVTITLSGNAATCIVEGTLITMADGTQKKVEDLVIGDMVMVYNHNTGKLDVSQIVVNVHESQEAVNCSIINLIFSNGQKTRISFEHGFFDVDLNEYVYINEENYQSMVGHRFYMIDGSVVTLVDAYITNEEVRVYSPVTYKHLNIFADNLLSIGGDLRGLFNIFELDENMKINVEKMNEDIEKYGLYTYEEWKDYLTYEQFIAFNAKYLKISIAKGLVTKEEIIRYIESYL